MFFKKKEKEEDTKKDKSQEQEESSPDWMSGSVVPTQAAVLVGAILLFWISKNPAVDTLCIVVGIGDLASLFVGNLLPGSLEEKTQPTAKVEAKPEAPTEQPAEKGEVKKKGSSVTEENVTVKKKVPLPAQQGVRKQETVQPVVESTPIEDEIPQQEEPVQVVTPTEMSDEDLDSLFNF